MKIVVTKDSDGYELLALRADQAEESSTFPNKGWFPHDLVHFVVEQEFGFRSAFWGRVGAGTTILDVASLAKAGGHASAVRADEPDDDIVELVQAERIVECFEAELWADSADNEAFRAILDAACRQSKVATPDLGDESIDVVRRRLYELGDVWRELNVGESLTLVWE